MRLSLSYFSIKYFNFFNKATKYRHNQYYESSFSKFRILNSCSKFEISGIRLVPLLTIFTLTKVFSVIFTENQKQLDLMIKCKFRLFFLLYG